MVNKLNEIILKSKRYTESSGLNAIPKEDGITELNIIQIIALYVIRTYRTSRIKSFVYEMTSYDPRFFNREQKKKELNDYLNKIGSQDGELLWNTVLSELLELGFVKNKALTLRGQQELSKLDKFYNTITMI